MLMKLADLTHDEVRDCADDAVVVLPIGSVEQHGPHLPMLTDTLLAEAVLQGALPQLEGSETPFVITPTLPVGSSGHHLFAAALSVTSTTLIRMLADLADSLVASGFRRLCIVNGHGGNDECIRIAIKDLVLRQPVAAAACSYWNLGGDAGSMPNTTPGHAGTFETSLMLAAHPGLVRTGRLSAETPQPPPLFDQEEVPGLCVQAAGEWRKVGGVTDAAALASRTQGIQLLDKFANGLADALNWFDRNTRTLGHDGTTQPPTTSQKEERT